MSTFVYLVRHGDSPKDGDERTRGLTEKGQRDVQQVTALLEEVEIEAVISSPYIRSVLTVEKLAQHTGKEIIVFEDLKERIFSSGDKRIADRDLVPLLEKSFSDSAFALQGGESNGDCQQRAVKVLKELLAAYSGKNIVIGIHGAVMTLMMGFYDEKYDLEFLHSTSKPDIYRMEFQEQQLMDVQRMWRNEDEQEALPRA